MGVLWGNMNRDATSASEANPELPSEIDADADQVQAARANLGSRSVPPCTAAIMA